MPEVFSGDFYRELDVSVPEQTWSSGTVITSLLRGMLGLDPDAPDAKLRFAPHLPPNWHEVDIGNLRVGSPSLSLRMQQDIRERNNNRIVLQVDLHGSPVEIEFSPEIPLGSRNVRATNGGQPLPVALHSHVQDLHAEVKLTLSGKAQLVLNFEGGIRPWFPPEPLRIGDRSHGLQVLGSTFDSSVDGAEVLQHYRAEVEGRANACSWLETASPGRVVRVLGGKYLDTSREGRAVFAVSTEPDSCVSTTASSWDDPTTMLLQRQIARPESAVHATGPEYGPYKTWTLQIDFIKSLPKPENRH